MPEREELEASFQTMNLDPERIAAELCRRELSFFVREFWNVIVDDPLVWAPHLDVLCNEVQAIFERVFQKRREISPGEIERYRDPKLNDLIINIPPGTTKSTVCTILAPVWGWTRDPSLRYITASYSMDLSTEHATRSRDVMRSPRFRRYFPNVQVKRDEDNKTDYKTTRNGQRYAASVGSAVTGVHAHIIIVDDPLNPKQAASPDQVTAANTFIDSTLSTRKVDLKVTPTILVMQRLDAKDPTAHLLEKKKPIRHVCLPAEDGPNVKPSAYRSIYVDGLLDPNRLGRAALANALTDLGSFGYAGQYGQAPAPAGGLVWKPAWFIRVPDAQMPLRTWAGVAGYGTDWDTAYTKEEKNAASAWVTSFTYQNRTYIDSFDFFWAEFPELVKRMRALPAPHYVEAKASGKSAAQTLVKAGISAIEIKVPGGTDKVARARLATPRAEAKLVYVRESIYQRLFFDQKQGVAFFPKGQFADVADTLAQAIQRHNTGGRQIYGAASSADDYDPLDDLNG